MSKTVYQYSLAGLYVCETLADESPLEPGVYLYPARCTDVPPPPVVPTGQWPRWAGTHWVLVAHQASVTAEDRSPVDKLKYFLANNPDVAALLKVTDAT